jgi:hypothetical protein
MKEFQGHKYCISFDTEEMPGKLIGISVALDKIFIGPNDTVRIDLRNHPLYEHLECYILNNPSNPTKQA